MKRINSEDKIIICRIAIRRWLNGLKRDQKRRLIKKDRILPLLHSTVTPPVICDLLDNYDETVRFLINLKDEALRKDKKYRRQRITVDMSKIEKISIDAALILSAEFDRWQVNRKTKLRPLADSWSPDVLDMLDQLGFFQLLSMKSPINKNIEVEDDITVLRLVSCDTADGKKVQAITSHLRWVAESLGQNPFIYEAIFEAAYNSVLHAYPKKHDFIYPPIMDRWWATASWSTSRNELKFLVYDQGVGIAETLPRWHRWERVVTFLSKALPAASSIFKEHATMINAALEVSRTSRDGGHGQGLSDIVAPIDELKAGKLRILSGHGEVVYYPGGKTVLTERDLHIGGTLVEWILPVHLGDRDDKSE